MLKDLRVDRESENDSLEYDMVNTVLRNKMHQEYVELMDLKRQLVKEKAIINYILMCSIVLLIFLIIVSFKLIVTKGVL